MKKEAYIKEILAKAFQDVGVFSQFEFSSWGMSHRPDYVILEPNRFTYFEIKSEYDSLDRLENQIFESRHLFTDMYLVAPMKHIEKAKETIMGFDLRCGAYALEDLEAGKVEPLFRQKYKNFVSIEAVCKILWSDEVYQYVSDTEIAVKGKFWSKKQKREKRQELFRLIYSNEDSLRILNEVLPNRIWHNRDIREQYRK